jgi:hypothetical protein
MADDRHCPGTCVNRPVVPMSVEALRSGHRSRLALGHAARACGVPRFEALPGHAAIPLRGDR